MFTSYLCELDRPPFSFIEEVFDFVERTLEVSRNMFAHRYGDSKREQWFHRNWSTCTIFEESTGAYLTISLQNPAPTPKFRDVAGEDSTLSLRRS
jgi:hypothetical protein